jgi:hypothetical protein
MKHFSLKSVILMIGLASTTFGVVEKQTPAKIKLDTSFVYSKGSYGLSQDTDVSVILISPSVEVDGWRLKAAIPYVLLNGPASIVGTAGSTPTTRSTQGLGDMSVSAGRKIELNQHGLSAELSAKVKFPTADKAKGLGTGEVDTSAQVEIVKGGGKVTPFGTLGYQVRGHNPSYPMKDGAFAAAGIAGKVSAKTVIGLTGNWRQPIVVGGKSAVEGLAFVQRKFSQHSRIQAFVLHGFTNASPDLAVGVTMGFTF